MEKEVLSKCCHVKIRVGMFACECTGCKASVDMNTGEPIRDEEGKIVYTWQFGGINIF